MIAVIDRQPFPLTIYKHDYPRLYIKDDPSFRYSKMFLTKLGAVSVLSILLSGIMILALLVI